MLIKMMNIIKSILLDNKEEKEYYNNNLKRNIYVSNKLRSQKETQKLTN